MSTCAHGKSCERGGLYKGFLLASRNVLECFTGDALPISAENCENANIVVGETQRRDCVTLGGSVEAAGNSREPWVIVDIETVYPQICRWARENR